MNLRNKLVLIFADSLFKGFHYNCFLSFQQAFWRSKMGRKDASTIKLPVDQYRKQIGKQ
jgi:gamma-glutamylcysteine synthetase